MRKLYPALILFLALLAPGALAQDQSLPPDNTNNEGGHRDYLGTACTATACELDVDESPASIDNRVVNTQTAGDTIIFDFPTPSAVPSTTTGDQVIQIIMSRCTDANPGVEDGGGNDPPYSLEVYCGGVLHQTLATDVTVTALDQNDSYPWTFGGSCAADGSDVQVRVTHGRGGGGGNRRFACTEALEWEVTHSTANPVPTVTITAPADPGPTIGGSGPYTITGTATDDGTVTQVLLTIQRQDDSRYWNSSNAWQVGQTTVAATSLTGDFDTWDYSWSWTADLETSVTITAEATDDLAATGSDAATASVDTWAPRIATGVRFQTDPTSGDTSFTLASDWTEANPGTPNFDYARNTDGLLGFVAGSPPNNNNSTITYDVSAMPLTGSDVFVDIRSEHTDTLTNGPTLSQDSGPFYVLPLTPDPPTVDNGTPNSLDVTINNPSEGGTGMLYAIRCDNTGEYVQAAGGTCGAGLVWQTLAAWGGSTVTVTGLSPLTSYDFSVAAGNPNDSTPTTGERSASAYSAAGTGSTTGGNPVPTVTINAPADPGPTIGGSGPYTIAGTATDDGTVTQVLLTIQRQDDSRYWNSSNAWQVGQTTVAATSLTGDFDTWDYSWSWTADLETSVTITAEATDDLAATGSDAATASVDTWAPRIATGVRFQTDPTSGDTSFTLASDWTEANAGTPRFAYDRNNTGVTGWVDGSAGNSSTRTFNVALTGSDVFVDIRSEHTDALTNGPTLSQDTGPFYVLPLTPNAPTVSNPDSSFNSLNVTINNPSEGGTGMLYAIRCDNTGEFVQAAGGTCGAGLVWQTLAAWGGSTVTVTGLSPLTSYDFSVAAANPKDATPTTGERSASAFGPAGSGSTSAVPVDDVTVITPTAIIENCNQITVTVAFTGDDNGDSTTVFERSPNGNNNWNPVGSCGTLGGASPRICVDATVADNSTNYYRAVFTDPDGVSPAQPEVIGPFDTTPYCAVNGTTIDDNNATATTCKLITTTSILTGDDNDDGYTEVQYNTTNSFPGTVACAEIGGASPRHCRIAGLTENQEYYLRFHHVDPDGVTDGLASQDEIIGPLNTGACAGNAIAPTILVLAPSRDAVIGGVDTVKVQVYDVPIASVSVNWSVNGGATAAATANDNYNCGSECKVFEFDLNTTTTGTNPQSLGFGRHYLTITATDADGHVAELSHGFRVNNIGDKAAGSGFLLRRTHGAQLCIDCHNLPSHSSQNTGSKYGNWAISCDTCHTPHNTRNIYLLREEIETPNSGRRPVRFESKYGARQDTADLPGQASYANEDTGTAGSPAAVDGPCQVCHTQTKNPFDQKERWRNSSQDPNNADNHYDDGRPTEACTNCHAHELGFFGVGGGCNSCHDSPAINAGKHTSHDEVWDSTDENTATDYDEVVSHATPTQYGYACRKCHAGVHINEPINNPTHDGSLANPFEVEVLFDTTALPSNPSGAYAGTYNENQDQGPDNRYWSWSDGSCSDLYCHSNAAPLGGTNSFAAVTWNQAATLDCTSCHDTEAAGDSAVATDLSAAHGTHIQSTSGETGTYSFTCDECHDATLRNNASSPWLLAAIDLDDKTNHVDGEKDVFFSATATSANNVDQSGGSYDGGLRTCSDTYCHSQGTSTVPAAFLAPNDPTLAWDGTATCESCHGGNAAATNTMSASNAHGAHMEQVAYLGSNLECARCHDDTVDLASDTTITDLTFHVNGARNVNMSNGGTYDGAFGCSNSYCHSNGTETPDFVDPPPWNSSSPLANDCKQCHGTEGGSIAGEPRYANNQGSFDTRNTHAKHVASASDCVSCHSGTVDGSGALLAAGDHLNNNGDVTVDGTIILSYTAATETCSNQCHGAGTPQWGGDPLVCLDCHTGTEGGALGDGAPNAVDDEWTTDGHGSGAGGSLTSAIGGCDYCHQHDASHTPTSSLNPYRLRVGTQNIGTQASYDYGVTPGNQVCLTCHGGDATGVSNSSAGTGLALEDGTDVDTAHFGTKHQQPEGGELCWDCHDPHGVPNNILMVQDQVSRTSDQYGVPLVTATVTFTDNTVIGNGGFVQSSNDGICQTCHDPNSGSGDETADDGPTKYWRSDGTDDPDGPGGNPQAASSHNIGQLCTDCHAHNNNFAGAGGDCLNCHGTTAQPRQAGGTRRAVQADFGLNSHHVGASVDADGNALFSQPNMGGALTNFDCVVCHAEGQVVNGANGPETIDTLQHKDEKIDLRDTDTAGAYWSYDKDTISGTPEQWMSGNATWESQTSAGLDPFCLSCHDVDGASQTFNNGTDEGRGFTGSATNPFADSAITNEYDQVDRGGVINIRNKVDAWVDNSNNNITPVDREGLADPRTPDGRPDPTDGIYSRHAIRSPGTGYGSVSVYGSNQIPAERWQARPTGVTGTWNDQSVMGCADCHTTDGANGTNGNAHGAGTEYLLKNKDGSSATEPDFDVRNADVSQINCYKCHNWNYYARERNLEHTGAGSDWVFTAGGSDPNAGNGSAERLASNGNIYGLPCTTCHAGFGWGSIHGTSDEIPIVDATGDSGFRQAYRFMNGASLRYYDPNGWNTSQFTCYTLSNADSWGSCTNHTASNPRTHDRVVRDIQY